MWVWHTHTAHTAHSHKPVASVLAYPHVYCQFQQSASQSRISHKFYTVLLNTSLLLFCRGGRSGGNFIRIKWLWSFYFDFKLCFIAVFIIYYIFFSSLCSIFLSLAHALFSLSSPLRVFATRDKLYICFYMLLLLLSLSWSVVVVVVMMVVQLQLAEELIFLLLLLFVVCIGYLVYSAVMIRSG